MLPGNEETEKWYDFWTHDVALGKGNITMDAPLQHINVHVRGGSALLTHAAPAYTTTETREGPFALLAALGRNGTATGSVYLDDGLAYPPGPSTRLTITAAQGSVTLAPRGEFTIEQKLTQLEVLGAVQPSQVSVNGKAVSAESWTYDAEKQKLAITHDGIDLNEAVLVMWAVPTSPPSSSIPPRGNNCTTTKRRSRR